MHSLPVAQAPQVPPQPSSPQVAVRQVSGLGPAQGSTHCPEASQVVLTLSAQKPQKPPQPSSPHAFPVQLGTHSKHLPLASQLAASDLQP